jgi:hypothetical protein
MSKNQKMIVRPSSKIMTMDCQTVEVDPFCTKWVDNVLSGEFHYCYCIDMIACNLTRFHEMQQEWKNKLNALKDENVKLRKIVEELHAKETVVVQTECSQDCVDEDMWGRTLDTSREANCNHRMSMKEDVRNSVTDAPVVDSCPDDVKVISEECIAAEDVLKLRMVVTSSGGGCPDDVNMSRFPVQATSSEANCSNGIMKRKSCFRCRASGEDFHEVKNCPFKKMRRCYCCGAGGANFHEAKDCPELIVSTPKERYCYRCGASGVNFHRAQQCTRRRNLGYNEDGCSEEQMKRRTDEELGCSEEQMKNLPGRIQDPSGRIHN